ncbi:hypothetical protein [Solicola sp. PLA-1-18]|uniref:hypothetical protein n=1 Tax=Solicola sp. PLA-1-18 TaxID=3380532 RepID=UPI003B7BA6ED
MRRATAATAAVLATVLLAGCGGGDQPGGDSGGGGADGCVGDASGQRVQQGVDGSLDDGTKLRVSYLTTDGGEDGAYVRWAPGAGGDPSPDPVRVGLGDSFTLGGTSYELTGVCDDAAWVTAADG